jgi:hypothetical protein
MDDIDQFNAIQSDWPSAQLWSEGGKGVVFLPAFSFPTRSGERVADLLLVPFPFAGYASRLLFSEPVASDGLNWSPVVACAKTWQAVSWSHLPENLSWRQLLAAHLRAVL